MRQRVMIPTRFHTIESMKRSRRPRAAIFDLDGTLVDTFDLVISSYIAATRDFLGRDLSREEVISRFGPTEVQMLRRDLPAEQHEQAIEVFLRRYREDHSKLVSIFEGIPEMLDRLRERNIPMGIVTGKGRDTADITLARLGWTDKFQIVVTGDESPNPKPAPDGLLMVSRSLDALPEDCVFVGDAPADISAGKSAGMTTVWASWHPVYAEEIARLAPDVVARVPADLLEIVR